MQPTTPRTQPRADLDDIREHGGLHVQLKAMRRSLRIQRFVIYGIGILIVLDIVLQSINLIRNSSSAGTTQNSNQSVNIGDGKTAESQRTYYTVDEVADREAVNADTVRRWISDGRVQGAYKVKNVWRIVKDYQVMPE